MKRPRFSKQTSRSLAIAMSLALSSGLVGGTSASFIGGTSNDANTLATASLTAPVGLTATATGTDVALSWSAGSFGGGTGFGHRVMARSLGVQADPRDGSAGPSATCSATETFSAVTRTNAATVAATHVDGGAASVAGSWACYRVDTEFPAAPATGQWYSQRDNPVATVMLGHVVRSVTTTSGGDPSKFDDGDSIVLTFNQPVNIATGPVSTDNQGGTPSTGHDVCIVSSSGTINIGRTAIKTNCSTSQAVSVGRITGLVMSPNGELGGYHATYSWSDCPAVGQCKNLTVFVGRRYRDNKNVSVELSASSSFEPTTTSGALTSATSPAAALCSTANTATATCRPVPTGSL